MNDCTTTETKVLARTTSRAVAVFEHRLEGRDTKEIIGKNGMTSYRIKLTVQAIKSAARQFAQGEACDSKMTRQGVRVLRPTRPAGPIVDLAELHNASPTRDDDLNFALARFAGRR